MALKKSRQGLIRVKKPAPQASPISIIGEFEAGDIILLKVHGYLKKEKRLLFKKIIFSTKETLLRRIKIKHKKTFDSIECGIIMKWNKYGRKISQLP